MNNCFNGKIEFFRQTILNLSNELGILLEIFRNMSNCINKCRVVSGQVSSV